MNPLGNSPFRRLLILAVLLAAGLYTLTAAPQDRVFYAGDSNHERFYNLFELSDGTWLVCGAADDLNWVSGDVPRIQISTTATNGQTLDNAGASLGKTAFILHLSADLGTILRVVHFPDGAVNEIRQIKASSPPFAATTGDLFISGTRGTSSNGGYYIARLNHNFLSAPASAVEFFIEVNCRGTSAQHATLQPWDVQNDGKVVFVSGREYHDAWAELERRMPDGVTRDNPPGWRFHKLDDGSDHFGTVDTIPAGRTSVRSAFILKTQRTNVSGLLRSFSLSDYDQWQRDENGYWRKGMFPTDAFWNNYWRYPETNGATNNMWGGDARGYIGYKLSGTGSTEGAPYTPRVGTLVIDKRNNHLYFGLSWASRLPGSNNPDFEPALIALDGDGYFRWWARLYKEYSDNRETPPQALAGSVATSATSDSFTSAELVGADVDLSRITSGSNGYVNGRRQLLFLNGANAHLSRGIVSFDPASGQIVLDAALPEPLAPGDAFRIDGTLMSRTNTSTPDQYVDGVAIDYSTPLQTDGSGGVAYVLARTHGNNVVSLWNGNDITANPGAQSFHNSFTGTNGNIHLSWIGKLRDEGSRSTLLAASYCAEFNEGSSFGSVYSDPNLDLWPSHNSGWPDLNTTKMRQSMWVTPNGEVCLISEQGRRTLTTRNAYQRNVRPAIPGAVTSTDTNARFTASSLAGAKLLLSSNCVLKFTNGANKNQTRVVSAFDNDTGAITLETALANPIAAGDSFTINEGVGQWNSFVRVWTPEMDSLRYSSLLTSAINPVDGSGAGANTELHGVFPMRDGKGLLVAGFHTTDGGNAMPTANVPAWGRSDYAGEQALLAKLYFSAESAPLTALQQWLLDEVGPGQDGSGNADGDSLIDRFEYAFDLDPQGFDPRQPFWLSTDPNGGYFDFYFRKRVGDPDLQMEIWLSSDLLSWNKYTGATTLFDADPDGDGTAEVWRLRRSLDLGSEDRLFLRALPVFE